MSLFIASAFRASKWGDSNTTDFQCGLILNVVSEQMSKKETILYGNVVDPAGKCMYIFMEKIL